MTIYIVASGGGHTGYAVAVAEALSEIDPSLDFVFVVEPTDKWSIERIEKRIKDSRYVFVTKPRKPLESLSKLIVKLPLSLIESLVCINKPTAVVATGSNHSIAPILTGLIKKSNLLISIEAIDRIHSCSLANKKLHDHLGISIALHWSEQRRHFKRGFVTGPIFEKPIYKPEDGGYILVLTGTMGHMKLFNLLLKTDLDDVVVQTGRVDPDYIISKKPKWRVFRFDPDIDYWVSKASIVISHQGLSIAEAALSYRKPVILAYNPDLPQTSGLRDSVLFVEKLNGVFINPDNAKPEDLLEAINKANSRKPPNYTNGSLVLAKVIKNSLE